MYKFEIEDPITIYKTEARDITVIKGKSSILYPFYRSTGVNSLCDKTWFPWMGYFDRHPELVNELYMVKPTQPELSNESLKIINKFLGARALVFIYRICNDEALAISCSLRGGIWDEFPDFREAIMACDTAKNYTKNLAEGNVIVVEMPQPKKQFAQFSGIKCSAEVYSTQAEIASVMEKITKDECDKYRNKAVFSIQDKKEFPSQNMLEDIAIAQELMHTQYMRSELHNRGFFSNKEAVLKNDGEANEFKNK